MIGLVHSRFSGDNVCHGNDKDQDSVGNLHSSFGALNDVDACFMCRFCLVLLNFLNAKF